MRKFVPCSLLVVCVSLSFPALAGNATGTWVGKVKLSNGRDAPFVIRLTQQGSSISGTLEGIDGSRNVTISEGRNEKDTITFTGVRVVNGNTVKFHYVGKLNGNSLDFVITRADGSGSPVKTHTQRMPG